ncbi:MAG: EamA family transporter [Anaerotignum sp.]|nr:EamA family transporter [Anaerotignum sp.]
MSYILVVIAGISWGLIGVFTKVIDVLGFTEMQMLFVKGVLATAVLFLITFLKDKNQLKLRNWKDIRYFIGTGIISFAFFSWAYMKAVNLTSLGVAAVLLYTAPTFVMLFSIFLFGEKMTKTKGIVLLMTFAGCIFVTGILEGGAAVITWQGIGIGIAAGIGYALYSIFGTYAIRAGYGSLTISFYTFLMATIVMTFLVEPAAVVTKITEMGQWPLAVSFALLTTVVPYLTYTKGLSGLPASKASVTATIEPVVAALLGIFVFHESASMLKITGIVLVLSSVVVMSRQGQK